MLTLLSRTVLLTSLIVGVSASIFAQKKLDNSLLWEISGNGLEQPSYVYGTIHMIPEDDFFVTDELIKAIDNSKRVVFEIDMEEMTDMNAVMPLMMQAFMKNDTTLADLLSEEDYKVVETFFSELGLPIMFLDRMKPMFLSALTAMDMEGGGIQGGGTKSYELEIMAIAQKNKAETGGLETMEFQMGIFDLIPYKEQAKMLVESIKNSDEQSESMEELVELYKKQDINGLQEMMHSQEDDLMEYEDLLLNTRNKNWIPIMEEDMAKGTTLFAVGAGHLPGEEGVLNLLKNAGYKVKALKGKPKKAVDQSKVRKL